MDHPITQVDIEADIMRLCERCEKVTHELAKRARAAAEADAAYKVAHAKAFLVANGPVAEREAKALVECEAQYQARRIAEALLLSAQEAGRNARAQLDALRSVNANVRPQVAA